MKARNPIGFTPGPVTFWTIVVYAAVLVPLLYVHESVPLAPASPPSSFADGVNLTEAWHDLTTITKNFHPYNSRDNERVGEYLLARIEEILEASGVEWTREEGQDAGGVKWGDVKPRIVDGLEHSASQAQTLRSSGPAVTVFDDTISNVTWASTKALGWYGPGYFEGTNKAVYIRGTEDEDGEWWKSKNRDVRVIGRGGVLVNAHYDSVSSGYGATDDGMGVVSILQILKHFTTEGNQPKRGIVLLLNNAEEDGLLGARAFAYSPLFSFPTTFVNLEGAGAGGRAILFRATDKEVTEAYRNAPHPFGSVLASDSFKQGVVRSQTDYAIFNGIFGQRGLDFAFYRPRSRYHTNQDDTRHDSPASLWHMLSSTLPAIEKLSKDVSGTYSGDRPDGDRRKVPSGKASDGVWFDVFGQGFAVFGLRGLFAWALTLLIVSPLVLMLVSFLLARKGRYYLFSRKINVHGEGSEDPVAIGGFRGLVRFPFALVVAIGLTFASALLVRKVNPLIIYSSEYAVWGMMLSLYYISFWTIMKGASVIRPSALQRAYAHIWMFVISWVALVAVAVFADRFRIGAFFPFAFLHSSVFVSTLISLLDLSALQPKQEFAQRAHDEHQERDVANEESSHHEALLAPAAGETENSGASAQEAHDDDEDDEEDAEEPTERTPLRGAENRSDNPRTTFGSTYRRSIDAVTGGSGTKDQEARHQPFEGEQTWSGRLPSWTWLVQLLVLAPINLIMFGQIALVLTASTQHTLADGGNDFVAYLGIAGLCVFVLLPLSPFIHRVTFHIPLILLAILAGTLIYNLVAFPFSANNRYKVNFQQDVYVDDGTSKIKIIGVEEYVRAVVGDLPSSYGEKVSCKEAAASPLLAECNYDGAAAPPRIGGVPNGHGGNDTAAVASSSHSTSFKRDKKKNRFQGLMDLNISRSDSGSPDVNAGTLSVDARGSKVCTLEFDQPISRFEIRGGAGVDTRFGEFPSQGVRNLQLYRRTWTGPWVVDVEWTDGDSSELDATDDEGDYLKDEASHPGSTDPSAGELRRKRSLSTPPPPPPPPPSLTGRLLCQWDDANVPGTIPAFDECLQYAPDWVAFTKTRQGLVRGIKHF